MSCSRAQRRQLSVSYAAVALFVKPLGFIIRQLEERETLVLGTIIRRCLGTIPLLLVLSIVSFAIIKSLPGDPVDILLGTAQRDIAPAQVSEMRRELGLDKPPAQQYFAWISGVVCRGQLGRSYRDGRPVAQVIAERLPATLSLVGTSLIFAFTFGITAGLLMAAINSTKFGPPLENAMISTALVFYSAPGFWLGFLVIALITQCPGLAWFPVLGLHAPGADSILPSLRYLILPALVLSCRRTAKVALFVRSSTLEELAKDYVIIARSKGLSKPGVIVRHVAKNSLLPAVSLAGLSLPALLGGSVLIENVFGWPGMGRLAVDATFGRNYPVLLALIMIYGALVVIANMMSDVVQMAMDPRMREHDQLAGSGGGP
jgi:peptide/nickel transport system permease protein